MADATVTAQIVPDGAAADIDVIVTDLLAESLDAVVADYGQDLVVSADVTHSEAADADGSAGVAAIEAAIVAVPGTILVGDIKIEADPVLDSPADVAIDISDADSVKVVWTATLSAGARIASIDVTSTDLAAVSIPVVIKGDPQGHESQKNSQNQVIVTVGPAPTGGEVGSPHALTLAVTDTNGRTSAVDSVNVAVTA